MYCINMQKNSRLSGIWSNHYPVSATTWLPLVPHCSPPDTSQHAGYLSTKTTIIKLLKSENRDILWENQNLKIQLTGTNASLLTIDTGIRNWTSITRPPPQPCLWIRCGLLRRKRPRPQRLRHNPASCRASPSWSWWRGRPCRTQYPYPPRQRCAVKGKACVIFSSFFADPDPATF